MTKIVTKVEVYIELTRELLKARVAAGGELPDEEEDEFNDELEDQWRLMSWDERDALDVELKPLLKEYYPDESEPSELVKQYQEASLDLRRARLSVPPDTIAEKKALDRLEALWKQMCNPKILQP